MIKTNKDIESYLEDTRVTLTSLMQDDFIKSFILKYGFTNERLTEIYDFYVNVDGIYQDLLTARGFQLKIGMEMQSKFIEASGNFSFNTGLFRKVLTDNPELVRELGLDSRRIRRIPGFIAQAINLYSNVLSKPYILQKVQLLAITEGLLQDELALINEVKTLHLDHTKAQGECQRLRELRDTELDILKLYMSQLKLVLFKQLKNNNEQVLERIKVFVRSTPRPKSNTTAGEPSGNTTPEEPSTETESPEAVE